MNAVSYTHLLGEVVKYDFSTTEEAAESTRDADVIVLNKVEVNEKSIGQAKNLKLICVTATAVSYTHLQTMTAYINDSMMLKYLYENNPVIKLIENIPVSYTHLDVYKRQGRHNTRLIKTAF